MTRSRCYIVAWVALAGGVALGAVALAQSGPADSAATLQNALEDLRACRFDRAESIATALATDDEDPLPRAWAIVAAARQRRGKYASAARAHRLFLAATDSPAMRQYALGQIRVCERDAQEPRIPVAPSKRLDTDALARLARVDRTTYTESTDHFVVRARNAELAKVLAAEAEVALDRICRVILAGQDYPHSVRINVWTDHEDYRKHASDAPEWAGGSFRYSVAGGTATRQIDLTQCDADGRLAIVMLDRVLPHEMCHLVLQEYFGDAACPLFLNEGLAMLAESEVDDARVELAGKAIAGKARLSLDGLFVRRRYDVDKPAAFYAESFSFVEFLHSRMTAEQFAEFLSNVKSGCTVADALQRALCVPASESFVGALASAWEDHAVAQAQYLEALNGLASGK
jgi:hypothetical protein